MEVGSDNDDDALSIGCDTSELFEGDSDAEDLIPELNNKKGEISRQTGMQAQRNVPPKDLSHPDTSAGPVILKPRPRKNGYRVRKTRWQAPQIQRPRMDLIRPQFPNHYLNYNNIMRGSNTFVGNQLQNGHHMYNGLEMGSCYNIRNNFTPSLMDLNFRCNGNIQQDHYPYFDYSLANRSAFCSPRGQQMPVASEMHNPVVEFPQLPAAAGPQTQVIEIPLPNTSLSLGDIFPIPNAPEPPVKRRSVKDRLGARQDLGYDEIYQGILGTLNKIVPDNHEAHRSPMQNEPQQLRSLISELASTCTEAKPVQPSPPAIYSEPVLMRPEANSATPVHSPPPTVFSELVLWRPEANSATTVQSPPPAVYSKPALMLPEANSATPEKSPPPAIYSEPVLTCPETNSATPAISSPLNPLPAISSDAVALVPRVADIDFTNDDWFHDFDLSDDEPIVHEIPPTEPVQKSPSYQIPKVLYSIRYPFGNSPEPKERSKLKTKSTTDFECVVRVQNLQAGDAARQLNDLWFQIAGIKNVSQLSDTSATIAFNSKLAADLFFQVYNEFSYEGNKLILEREVITID